MSIYPEDGFWKIPANHRRPFSRIGRATTRAAELFKAPDDTKTRPSLSIRKQSAHLEPLQPSSTHPRTITVARHYFAYN